MSAETKLIRALAEDLAVEILASYAPEDFKGADFTSLGQAFIYLRERGEEPGPALEELVRKVQSFAGSQAEGAADQGGPTRSEVVLVLLSHECGGASDGDEIL